MLGKNMHKGQAAQQADQDAREQRRVFYDKDRARHYGNH